MVEGRRNYHGRYILTLVFALIFLVSLGMISHNAFAQTALPPPSNLTAMAASSSQINLSWTAPQSVIGVSGYKIERSLDGTTFTTIVSNTGSTATMYSDGGLAQGTTYTYRVSTIYPIGTSAPSNTASATTFTVPSSPQNLQATAGDVQVTLLWNPPSNNGGSAITGYNVYRGTTAGGESTTPIATGITSTTYIDTGLTNGQKYFYTVKAVNSVGTGSPSNEASATPEPSGVTVQSIAQNNTSIFGMYTLLCSHGTSNYANGTTTCATGESRINSGYTTVTFPAPAGQTFGVEVEDSKSCSFNHWSDNGNDRFRLFTAQSPPPVLTAVFDCSINPTVSSAPQNLLVYSGNAQVGLSWSVPSNNGGSAISNYTIYRGTSSNGETLLKEIGNSPSYLDGNVTNGQTYYYYVTATNSAGQSLPSNEVSALPTAPTSTSGTIPRTGLEAEWKFENNAFDTSGNRNDGTTGATSTVYGGCCPKLRTVLTPGPGTYYQGQIGLALGYSGTFIDRVANSASLNFGNGSLSISGWIKTNQTSPFLYLDHRRNNDGIYSGYSLEGNNGIVLGRIRDSSGHDVYVQAGPINDNQFHHIAFVVDRSTQTSRIYLDNKLQALANISQVGNIDQNSIGVDLGYTVSPNTAVDSFSGLMDQIRIYNRTITDNEIQSLYLEGPSSGQPTSPQNLVANSGNNQVSLSWSAPSSNGAAPITNYNIYRGSSSGSETFLIKTGNIQSYTDKTVSNGQKYFYEVSAINSDGESTTSNEVNAVPATIPSAPQLFTSSVCNGAVDLDWNISNNGGSAISNYTIYRGTSSNGETLLKEIGNDNSYSDNSVTNGQTYYYYVKAVNSVGQSSPSNEVSGTPANSSCMPIAGLVGEWKFENNALDSSGNGNNGATSGTVSYVTGKVGQALYLNGTGIDRIPYSPSLDFPTTSFSISLWIKTTSSNLGLILDHRINNDECYSGYSIEGYGNNGQLVGRLRICAPATDPSANFDAVTNPINDGAWHHIAFVVDRATHTSRIYQDDVLVDSLDISNLGNISQTMIGVDLGNTGSPNTPDISHSVTLDQVRIYNIVLTNSEISSLYNEQPPATITLNNVQSTSGTTSSSDQMTLSNFNAESGSNQLLIVGISANNQIATSVTFNGQQLTRAVSSFNNNDAEFWYLKNPSGTGNIVATFGGQTQAVVGAYSFANVNQTTPIANTATNSNTASSSPSISITANHANDWVLDLPSIYGGQNLGSPTCTQEWNTNIPSAITGASSSTTISSPGSVTCKWTASNGGDLWDDVAVEIKALG